MGVDYYLELDKVALVKIKLCLDCGLRIGQGSCPNIFLKWLMLQNVVMSRFSYFAPVKSYFEVVIIKKRLSSRWRGKNVCHILLLLMTLLY